MYEKNYKQILSEHNTAMKEKDETIQKLQDQVKELQESLNLKSKGIF